ncbi:MAG: biotin--[acetyl-CoA-carboxylase] ligase [Azonexaceae bacterium]|nr:biotin--[acetyl-CoA-carboxylase] ligase [Azonexaceae bacterium]
MTLLDPVRLKAALGALAVRFDVDALDRCASTNDEIARRAAANAPSGTVVVADRQSAGRGRRGRHWLSAPESSLTFSMLWRFGGSPSALSGLSLAVGVALARALDRLGARGVHLKWPNDVLWQNDGQAAKLAGILIELSSDRRATQVIIGIGLNLAPPVGDLGQPVAGLEQTGAVVERHQVLAAILAALHEVLAIFAVDGFATLKNEWQTLNAWQDRPVVVLGDTTEISGICRGADDDGALLVDTDAGLRRVLAGDLSLRGA